MEFDAVALAQQAVTNQTFLHVIDETLFPDWVVTVAFYKAVHLVEELLVRKGTPNWDGPPSLCRAPCRPMPEWRFCGLERAEPFLDFAVLTDSITWK